MSTWRAIKCRPDHQPHPPGESLDVIVVLSMGMTVTFHIPHTLFLSSCSRRIVTVWSSVTGRDFTTEPTSSVRTCLCVCVCACVRARARVCVCVLLNEPWVVEDVFRSRCQIMLNFSMSIKIVII